MADQSRAHDRGARGQRCGLGQLLGVSDVRASSRLRTCVMTPVHFTSRNHRALGLAACAAISWLVCAAAVVHAHEIGTTRVAAKFSGSWYQIDVTTDTTSLAEKLQAVSGDGAAGTTELDAQALRARLAMLDATFRRRVVVSFDGIAVTPEVTFALPGADDTTPVTIRLIGQVPAGARTFNWTYGWTFASYSLTMSNGSDAATTEWLDGTQTSQPFALNASVPAVGHSTVLWRYLALGFTHILPYGLDHVLFVLGIFLLSGRLRSVLTQVSAFTVAHSITLGLSMYGLVSVRPAIVEPLIAVSIAYVAIENLFVSELKSWRLALVFAFGLLHGMGFAGALKELGLPRSEFVTALVAFNSGVEGGQLAVIAGAFLLVGWYGRNQNWYRPRIV